MQITLTLPEKQFIAENPATVAAKIQLFAALGLYQTGQLSLGAASELAQVDLYTFLSACRQYGFGLQTQTPDELEADFKQLSL